MNTEIFSHLEDILEGLKEIQRELEIDVNDPKISVQVIDEIEQDVYEPLLNAIDSLSDILESVQKMDDADAFYDPYGEGLE
jgi:hypothetical protein